MRSALLQRACMVVVLSVFLGSLRGGLEGADLLRYTVRYEPFSVELTLPNGSKQTRPLPRQPTHFFHRANFRWPVPEGPDQQLIQGEIRWVGFPPGYHLINSFGIDVQEQRFETTLGKLRKAVFIGGDFRTVRSPNGLILVTRGTWPLADSVMLSMADRIAQFHTAVWQDHGLPDHRVFLVGKDGVWGGEGRTNSSIMEGRPEQLDPAVFAQLLSHEMFHQWNGRRLNWDNNEELYWFTEGFTEYYSVVSLWRAGIWSFDQVLHHFNSVARSYFGSTRRNLIPSRMVALRQSDGDAMRLPYQQGYLLAAHWNRSGTSLDAAMRNLIKTNDAGLSNARIAQALRAIGVEQAAEEIQRYVVEGQTITLRPEIWGACAKGTTVEVRGFDMGFDLAVSEKTGVIQGVKPDSNAWRAGVRDGQKWKPFDVAFGDASYQAGIEVEDRQGKRQVRYHPASASPATAPHYKANSARCDPATLALLPAPR